MHLMSIEERLNTPNTFHSKFSQAPEFISIIKNLELPDNASALSVSTGDGMWDYFVFKNNPAIKKIIATDIVDKPVNKKDEILLEKLGKWDFVKVEPEINLPFENETFDLVFHQDVVEHVEKPFLFLEEQYRVLKKGGVLVFGTPNLFRPANILKILLGKLRFPIKLGYNKEIGDYIHVQEFYEQQMLILLKEIGFENIETYHSFWENFFVNIFSLKRSRNLMAPYLTFSARK